MNKIKRWILVLTAAAAVTAGLQSAAGLEAGGHQLGAGRPVAHLATKDTGWG
ncbi:hypothetical protein ABT095_06475 [Kitasatospora sp. NPDC002227]|uniref:hypothetical protein n=1 Tax=Kitasatospora sp. NPDC002227 TaxID=3154773 RepID=UPI00332FE9AA